MGTFSDFLEDKLLDHVFGSGVYTPPGNVWVGLSSGTTALNDADTGTSLATVEPATASGYARVQVANDKTTWTNASAGSLDNAIAITFGQASGSWGTVSGFAVVDAETNGNILGYGDLTTPRTIVNNDTASFASGAIVISLD